MAAKLYSYEEISAILKNLDCTETGKQFNGESGILKYWVTPWGFYFSVPFDDYVCAYWTVEGILKQIEASK